MAYILIGLPLVLGLAYAIYRVGRRDGKYKNQYDTHRALQQFRKINGVDDNE